MHVSCVVGGVEVVDMSAGEFGDRFSGMSGMSRVWSSVVADLLDGHGGQQFRLSVWRVAGGGAVVTSCQLGSDDRVGVAEVADTSAAFAFVAEVTRVQGVSVVASRHFAGRLARY